MRRSYGDKNDAASHAVWLQGHPLPELQEAASVHDQQMPVRHDAALMQGAPHRPGEASLKESPRRRDEQESRAKETRSKKATASDEGHDG